MTNVYAHTSAQIHPTAIVSAEARIGEGCTVGPYSIIGPGVTIGARSWIGPHVVVEGHTSIGEDNKLFQFCSIGSRPQDLKYSGEPSTVTIGDKNIIREYVTIQPGTTGGGMRTVVGDNNLFMASSHVGHDTIVGSGNIFANCATLAGHVQVGNFVTVGGLAAVHQFARLGDLAFVGGGAMVSQDVPSFCIAQGDRASLVGLNKIGMERRGYSPDEVAVAKRLYRDLFMGDGVFKARLESLIARGDTDRVSRTFLTFISSSTRGVCALRSATGEE